MFYRASVQSDGSGLGLYIVKNAIEKLSGQINVNSKYTEGTTFIINLPNRPPAVAE
jgi:signal transduction histidine kinase